MKKENATKRASTKGEGKKKTPKKEKKTAAREKRVAVIEEVVGETRDGKDIIDRITDPEDGILIVKKKGKNGKMKTTRTFLKEIPRDIVGRPTVMTDQTKAKLELWFKIGCTIQEACMKADIDRATYARYCQRHPEFCNMAQEWRDHNPVAEARKTIMLAMRDGDVQTALAVMRVKKTDEGWNKNGYVPPANVEINFSKELKERAAKYDTHYADGRKVVDTEARDTTGTKGGSGNGKAASVETTA